jgi:LysR family glycine cleavage system transcriptional activator
MCSISRSCRHSAPVGWRRGSDFGRRYPDAGLNLSVRLQPFDFDEEPFDGAIHHGDPVWAGAIAEHLFDEEVIPVASRVFRDRHKIRVPEDLTRVPRLAIGDPSAGLAALV